MRRLESGQDPLQPGQLAEGPHGIVVGHSDVAGAAGVAQVGVLGADARVVEAGGDRMRLEDLPLLVRQHGGEGAVQDPGAPGHQGRSVASVEPLAAGLDTDQLDPLVVDEGDEGADRVRSAPDAGDHARRQRSLGGQRLLSRLVADPPLQVAHDRRVRSRADGRADDVVGGAHVAHPVADRGADRLLERAGAGLYRHHLGPQQTHALYVGGLTAHVLGTHVDHAVEAEQSAGGGRRHAVLAGSGLGDDPRLPHPPGQERLAHRVVDLVRAGVCEVLALQIDAPADPLREPRRQVERRGSADVVAEEPVQLGPEARVLARLAPGLGQLVKRRDQDLGHVAASVGAEALLDRDRHAGTPGSLAAVRAASAKDVIRR